MSTGTAVLAAFVIFAMVGLGVLATKVNRRSSEGPTRKDTKGPLDQTGSGTGNYQDGHFHGPG